MEIKKLLYFKLLIVFLLGGFINTLNAQAIFKYTFVDPAANELTITNVGDMSDDVGSYWLCLGPGTYQQISGVASGSTMLSPGMSITLPYNMDAVSDGLSLFSVNSFGSSDPNILVDFVQWGAGNQARSGQAVTAGRWDNAASFVSVSAPYITSTGGSAAAWSTAEAMIKYTFVDPINNELSITNTGTVAQDVGSYWLCLGPGTYQLINNVTSDNTLLNPGESITLPYNMNEANDGLSLFSTNSFGSSDPDILLDFVQWGAGNQPRSGQAVTAGRWDNASSFVSGTAPYSTSTGGTAAAWMSCDVVAGDIMFDPTGANNTTSISGDGLSAVICIDGNADPLNINIASGSMGSNSGWIITNQLTGEILALPTSPPFNLDGAGLGVCNIYYIRYEDGLIGKTVGQNISDLTGCFDLSNYIEVIREAADGGTVAIDLVATGNPNNTTSFNGDTEAVICVDSQPDPLVIVHDNPGAENLSYRYVITNEDSSEILAISPSATIDLNGAGVGNCRIWGWSYRGLSDNGASFIGSPLSDLQAVDCSDLSDNSVLVIREAADGGTVAIDLAATGNPNNTTSFNGDTEAVICVDSQPDPLVIVHENPGAENLSYRYVITNEDSSEILAISPSATIDLNGAGVGNCRIWGWSYRGLSDNGASFIGSPLSDLQAVDCSDLSDNSVLVIREAADGGTVAIDLVATGNPNNTTSFNGDTEAVICVDSQPDPLVIVHENPDAENLSYRYVITNEDSSEILAISPSATIDLNGAGVGNCRIWGWSYRGLSDNGASFIGSPLSDLQAVDCSDLSDNSVLVIREAADGGTVAIDLVATGNPNNTTSFNGDTEAVICVDSQPDPLVIVHDNPGAENLSYRYVITNEDSSEILAISPSATIDLNGAGVGNCRIWGWSYRGLSDNGASFIGSPLSDLQAVDCSDLSDNSVLVIREAADGGTVSLADGSNEISICAGDSTPDPLDVIHSNPDAENLSYRYVITNEDSSEILAISGSATIDLDGAGEGICQIWGWSYRGLSDNGASFIGSPLADLQAVDCSDISDNSITVTRLTGTDCDSLSIDDLDSNFGLTVFPNPTQDVLNIRFDSNVQLTEFKVEVYNVSGQKVYDRTIEYTPNTRLNLEQLEGGLYLVNIINPESGSAITKRIVKQ